MYLTSKVFNTEDFLQALNFVCPQGHSIEYFITPEAITIPTGVPYQTQMEKLPDESQTYFHTPPAQKIDQAITPAEFSSWEVPELSRRQPTPTVLPAVTDPGNQELGSPFVKVLSESKMFGADIKLLETYGPFPKNTVFHCVINKLSETKLVPDEDGYVTRANGERVRVPIPDGPGMNQRDINRGKPSIDDMGGLYFEGGKGELDFMFDKKIKEASGEPYNFTTKKGNPKYGLDLDSLPVMEDSETIAEEYSAVDTAYFDYKEYEEAEEWVYDKLKDNKVFAIDDCEGQDIFGLIAIPKEMINRNGELNHTDRTWVNGQKIKESIDPDIFNEYQNLRMDGLTDKEARYTLVELFGQSEEDDDYASFIDYMESVSSDLPYEDEWDN